MTVDHINTTVSITNEPIKNCNVKLNLIVLNTEKEMILDDENKAAKNKNDRIFEWLIVVGFISNLFALTQRTKYTKDSNKMKQNCVQSEMKYVGLK